MFASLVISANAADRFQQQTGVNNYCLDLIMILGSTLGRWLPWICFCSSEAVCLVWPVMGARTGTRLVCTVLRTSPPSSSSSSFRFSHISQFFCLELDWPRAWLGWFRPVVQAVDRCSDTAQAEVVIHW